MAHAPGPWREILPYSCSMRMKNSGRLMQIVIADIRSAADPQHAEKKRSERDLHTDEQPHGPKQNLSNLMQRPKPASGPLPRNPRAAGHSCEKKQSTDQQSRLELYTLQQPPERNRVAVKTLGVTEDLRKGTDRKNLHSEQREDHTENHSVNVQRDPRRNLSGPGQQPEYEKQSHRQKRSTREQKKPIRCVEQHEPQVPPAVSETSKVWGASPLVRPKGDGNLGDARPKLRRLDDKLRSEFHPRASQVHALVNRACEPAHPAVAVADACAKEEIQQCGEAGISNVFVVPRHCSRLDLSAKPVAHDHVVALPQHFCEPRHFAEIITVVRIAHDDKRASRGGYTGA